MGEGGSVFSLSEGVATLHPGEDVEEAALFLEMSPEVHTVRTDGATACLLAARWGTKAKLGTVMRAESVLLPTGGAEDCPPAPLYPLLQSVFGESIPPFDVWYADVHHRLRRGAFHATAAKAGETVVSCAMTVAEVDKAVLIGGVATHPDHRGQGLASACVTVLAHHMGEKAVWICPKNEAAERLYRRLGFAPSGEFGIVEKKRG
jgi:GNAT superfamily N-acetyltransferase